MRLKLERKYFKDNYTIGNLYIDDQFFCNTLEDKNRDLNKNGRFDNGEMKVYGETCIPFGKYKVTINMSPKFGRELPRLIDVPSFEGVLIHRGNTAEDSAGCILVGENKVTGKVLNSTPYEERLVKVIKEAITHGEEVTVEIV
jgi:hypothetical protein